MTVGVSMFRCLYWIIINWTVNRTGIEHPWFSQPLEMDMSGKMVKMIPSRCELHILLNVLNFVPIPNSLSYPICIVVQAIIPAISCF